LTLPAGPDTLVGRATTDTLTNKTLTSPAVNGATIDAASTIGGVSGTNLVNAYNASAYVVPAAFRNKITNGAFDVWQRGTGSFTTQGYTADQWILFVGVGATASVTQSSLLGSSSTSLQARNAALFTVSSVGTTDSYLEQRIEGVQQFAGQNVTVSFQVASSTSSRNLSIQLVQNFGTGGTPSGQVPITAQTVTTSSSALTYTKVTATFAVPNTSGKAYGTNGDDYLRLLISNPIASGPGNIYITDVQAEIGSVATVFERKTYQQELAACQRHFVRYSGAPSTVWYVPATFITASVVQGMISAPVAMRTIPTLSTSVTNLTTATPTAGTQMSFQQNTYITAGTFTSLGLAGTVTSGGAYTNLPLTLTAASLSFTTGTAGRLVFGPGATVDLSAEL
jgi:hypothetical protein